MIELNAAGSIIYVLNLHPFHPWPNTHTHASGARSVLISAWQMPMIARELLFCVSVEHLKNLVE